MAPTNKKKAKVNSKTSAKSVSVKAVKAAKSKRPIVKAAGKNKLSQKPAAKAKQATTKASAKKTPKSKAKVSAKSASSKNVIKKTTKPPTTAKATAKKVSAAKAAKVTTSLKATPKKSSGPKGKAWLQPLDDRILVEVAEQEQTTPGGLILIDSSSQPDNLEGFVVAVGRGHQNKKGRIRPIELKAGDKIIFSKYAGDKVSQDGVNFVIIRETEVLGFASH